jgi:putative drug exporter of the RND superfamily
MFHTLAVFVVRRARWVLVAGLVALIGGVFLGMSAFDKLQTEGFDDPDSEASRAAAVIDERYGGGADYVLLVDAGEGRADQGSADAEGRDLTQAMVSDPGLANVVSFWSTRSPSLLSEDGTEALVLASAAEGPAGLEAADVIERYSGERGAITVHVGGGEAVGEEVGAQLGEDIGLAEGIAIPLVIALLVLALGNVVAALATLAIGLIAILGTFAELSVFGSLTDVSIYAVNLTIGLGLGLAVDYGLLMVARVREERAAGRNDDDAVVRAVETAGRTIAFSAATVGVALAALLVFPQYFLRSFAYAGIGVVVISAVTAVVLLPALLAVLGPRIDAWKVPGVRGIRGSESPLWRAVAQFVMRRPLVSALPVVIVLLVAASPLLGVSFGTPDDRVLPTSASSRQVGEALRNDFASADASPIVVVIPSAVDPANLADYARTLSQEDSVQRVDSSAGTFVAGAPDGPGDPDRFSRPDAERLEVVSALDPRSDQAQQLVADLRAIPTPAGNTALVGGETAILVDSIDSIAEHLPLAAVWILLTTAILLFLFTGSVLQPIRALAMSALTLSATLGIMVFIFQDGYFADVLGFTPQPLNTSMLVLLFCIAFGLSMDYEVFVLSRIKEAHDQGADLEEAVAGGLARSGRIVSTAAALIAVSFLAFVSSEVSFMQFFGLGTALAILIDATLVRGVLVPAGMRLLGRAAWWAPAPLREVHRRIGLAEPPAPAPATETPQPVR